ERPVDVAREELCRHRRPHVVGDDEHRSAAQVPLHEVLGQVRLPSKRVGVVRRLLGEPEAKEVEGEDGIGLGGIEQAAPVERARGKSVEQHEREPGPLTLEDVDAMPAEALAPPALAPFLDPPTEPRAHEGGTASEVARTCPWESIARTAYTAPARLASISVSNPVERAAPIGRISSSSGPVSSSQRLTAVAPFQLANAATFDELVICTASVGLVCGSPCQRYRKVR